MLGWVACTNKFGVEPGVLFMIQFFWQFPHFWAIGWFMHDDYKKAEDRGYFKIDCLNVNIYKNIKSEQELVELMIKEPDWDMLKDPKVVENLFHLNSHYNIVSKLEPKNIEQLAAVLAIIRPAKRHLMYKEWKDILIDVWVKPTDGSYFFKKSHAVAYAHAIVVQMNLIQRVSK
jgi:hypothetical protein